MVRKIEVRNCISKLANGLRTRRSSQGLLIALLLLVVVSGSSIAAEALRPPSVPLVACDPYFSVWSASDTLTGDITRHWTGRPYPLTSLIRIDGKAYRLMGNSPDGLPTLEQKSLKVLPTRTIYTMEGAGVQVEMTFMQPALPDDIDLMSRPITYLTWNCTSADGKSHDVSVYFDAGMELVVNEPSQLVEWGTENISGLEVLKASSKSQNILARKGDNVRIDWGYFYLASSQEDVSASAILPADKSRMSFVGLGKLNEGVDSDMPRTVSDNSPVMAMQFDLGSVAGRSGESCRVILSYDDIYSVLYFGKQLPAYWKKNGTTIQDVITDANNDYSSLAKRCEQFDNELMQDLYDAGGEDYQMIGALAYRQALGANKIVADTNGMPLMFSKENFSNGCMGTVDVFYPFAPQVLLLNPTLAKASFVPILEYGQSERWRFPFAPHDVGTYPHAMGQVYGGGERSEENQMPVEECGNMILLVAAVVEAENDISFAKQYWDILTTWAEYLKSKGLDPENQLCTDDFAGHLAHNVNLSLKAIVALGAYAEMADMMGETDTANEYRETAEEYVKEWMEMADDGDHYRLAFDKPGTWSQKYNLVWDRLLELNLFPESVAKKEMAYYRKNQNTYGLPLDNRSDYTKLDWIVWTASITGEQDDFEALIAPIVKFLNETPDRVPMTDWYWTHNARHRGFQARPVVGGVFIRLMDDRKLWDKWVDNADSVKGKWLSIPKPPKIVNVVDTALDRPQRWFYTFERPDDNWMKPGFDPAANGFKRGRSGFGTPETPGSEIGTRWDTSDIWIRRNFRIDEISPDLHLWAHHDENAQVYINGELIANLYGYTGDYMPFPLDDKARDVLKTGINTIAIYCNQTTGGQYIDAGFVEVIEQN
ncbi:hypothetical protein STSP2_02298 [Anaerohalosphaera lusitana]|uniref:Glutaminase n=1 Tax=Anaerohalosphaera lusitana TaxID=1936003 RepID=A0A1U9NMG5_9BACT|nr:glutaminase family protein [Anaerohalosphaera lusitana]AQT69111.1 hypothetical protein STSP2_02298 [Anaerohalosphaera lusitana]